MEDIGLEFKGLESLDIKHRKIKNKNNEN